MIPFAIANFLEAANGLCQRGDFTLLAREHFSDQERLGQESFDTTSTLYNCLVNFAQFIHTENRDDVLQFSISL